MHIVCLWQTDIGSSAPCSFHSIMQAEGQPVFGAGHTCSREQRQQVEAYTGC